MDGFLKNSMKPAVRQVVFGLKSIWGGIELTTIFYCVDRIDNNFGGKGPADPLPQILMGHRATGTFHVCSANENCIQFTKTRNPDIVWCCLLWPKLAQLDTPKVESVTVIVTNVIDIYEEIL